MSKPDFAQGLNKLRGPAIEPPSPAPQPERKAPEQPGRVGKVILSAYFDPAVRQQLAIMAARQNKTQVALIAEGLNMLFAHYGESQIARG